MTAALSIRGLHRHYGGVIAVDGVDLDLPPGTISALTGPNGAGKTTLLHCVTGLDPGARGTITLMAGGAAPVDLSGRPPHLRARLGLTWTFQRIEVFAGLTVAENILVGAENRHGTALLRGLAGLPARRRATARSATAEILARLGLGPVADTAAGTLPGGTMRLIELGRALAARPAVLLLDEPASGLDDGQIRHLTEVLRGLAADGLTVLLVEHDARFVAAVADTVHRMVGGRIVGTERRGAAVLTPTAEAAASAPDREPGP